MVAGGMLTSWLEIFKNDIALDREQFDESAPYYIVQRR